MIKIYFDREENTYRFVNAEGHSWKINHVGQLTSSVFSESQLNRNKARFLYMGEVG